LYGVGGKEASEGGYGSTVLTKETVAKLAEVSDLAQDVDGIVLALIDFRKKALQR